MSMSDFLAVPACAEAIRRAVLQVQREVAPEELEVTIDYVDPLIELAARNELPSADTPGEAGQFGAADWMLLPILFLVLGVLQSDLDHAAFLDLQLLAGGALRRGRQGQANHDLESGGFLPDPPRTGDVGVAHLPGLHRFLRTEESGQVFRKSPPDRPRELGD